MKDSPRPEHKEWAEAQVGREADWTRLAGDGSDKLFWRLTLPGESLVAVDGGLLEKDRFGENRAFLRIGRHLDAQGIPVPKILAQEPGSGFFLIEDLGDIRLADLAGEMEPDQRIRLYGKALGVLVEMQARGAQGFKTEWCSQTPRYDREMILKYETGYFLRAFAHEYCGADPDQPGLWSELEDLAGRAAGSRPTLFLHRDFQSRNIMVQEDERIRVQDGRIRVQDGRIRVQDGRIRVQDGRIRVIDYQAGRLGPPGYDLASLLLDPYVGLSPDEQETLLEHYLDRAGQTVGIDADSFRRDYPFLALHRTMQMLGAFAFLSQVKGRPGFARHIPLALDRLRSLLTEPELARAPLLRDFVDSLNPEGVERGDQ